MDRWRGDCGVPDDMAVGWFAVMAVVAGGLVLALVGSVAGIA